MKTPKHIAESDGKTLWINGPCMLLGRFSERGSDVLVDGQCVEGSCRTTPDWEHFVEAMMRHHQINVGPYKRRLKWIT